jgi:hypothetical protein
MGSERVDRALRPLVGLTVWRCLVDSRFTLRLFSEPDDPSATVCIETEFRYVDGAGRSYTLRPGKDLEKLGPALNLFGQQCTGVSGDDEGHLTLSFVDSSRLEVDPSPDYEAWEIPELGLIALPGGGLSVTPTSNVPSIAEAQEGVDHLKGVTGWDVRLKEVTETGEILVEPGPDAQDISVDPDDA